MSEWTIREKRVKGDRFSPRVAVFDVLQGGQFVARCESAEQADRIVAALAQQPAHEVTRLRHEIRSARTALQDYYPDRDNPAALIDRIERAWHAIEIALAAAPEDGAAREVERIKHLAEIARSRALLLNGGCDDYALQEEILDYLGRFLGPFPGDAALAAARQEVGGDRCPSCHLGGAAHTDRCPDGPVGPDTQEAGADQAGSAEGEQDAGGMDRDSD